MKKKFLKKLKKLTFLPQKVFLPILYKHFTGKNLKLENPIEFNEKIQWYKMFYQDKLLNTLIDKYEVKKYVANLIGSEYIIPTYGVYQNPKEIDYDKLPNKFVIKTTHTNQHNIIVTDKGNLDKKKVKRKFRSWLYVNQYYKNGQEWGYKDIEPRIIIEQYIKEAGKEVLTDYKFFCFDGVPKFLEVHIDRTSNYIREIYDLDFKRLPINKGVQSATFKTSIVKPINFENMIEVAKKLSKPFPFVRVDLYSINGKTVFGELTFYPADGRKDFYPDKYNKIIGDYFKLPSKIVKNIKL